MSQYEKMVLTVPMGDDALSTPEQVWQFLLTQLNRSPLPDKDGVFVCHDVNGNRQELTVEYYLTPEKTYDFTVVETRKVTCAYRVIAVDREAAEQKLKSGDFELSEDLSIDEVVEQEIEKVEEMDEADE